MPYDKQPYIEVKGFKQQAWQGYSDIVSVLEAKLKAFKKDQVILAIDTYPGVILEEIETGIVNQLNWQLLIKTDDDLFMDASKVSQKIKDFMTEDRVFGVKCHYTLEHFIDTSKYEQTSKRIQAQQGLIVVIGVGASLLCKPDVHVYADMARWEIQQRYRHGTITNWKQDIPEKDPLRLYKRGFFFEWPMADCYKKTRFNEFDYLLDTNITKHPKMMTGNAFRAGLKQTTTSPFRVVPFFDPGVWGGQWMKEVCDLDRSLENYAWCFDCVPEENSLLLKIDDVVLEVPSIDVVYAHPRELLGEQVHARFGTEFPIRFDFLDTVKGQNLSLQVHPLTEYIQDKFNMHYTQDESYYILDALDEAQVYLGVKTGTTKEAFFNDLKKAQSGEGDFPVEQYVNKIPAKKHDHFLIPAGTVHCSGADTMVLEISSTPFIFTFKLWDWGRLGMDGLPRPIHLKHGYASLMIDRDTKYTMEQLVNRVQVIGQGDGWVEERTGLHPRQFIETRRHWQTNAVIHHTEGKVNVINLVEGDEAVIESPTNEFEPVVIHYAETIIIPANVSSYMIRPCGPSSSKQIATIKAFVRT